MHGGYGCRYSQNDSHRHLPIVAGIRCRCGMGAPLILQSPYNQEGVWGSLEPFFRGSYSENPELKSSQLVCG